MSSSARNSGCFIAVPGEVTAALADREPRWTTPDGEP